MSCAFCYVSRTIRWYVTVEISFVRESIQGDEQTTATFRTTPEIMADVKTYDAKELLVILFNHVTNFFISGKWVAFRLCAKSRDKPLPLPIDDRSRVLHSNTQVSLQKKCPQYPKPQRRCLLPMVRSRAYS